MAGRISLLVVFVLLGVFVLSVLPAASAQTIYAPPLTAAYARGYAVYPYGYPGYPYNLRRYYRQTGRYMAGYGYPVVARPPYAPGYLYGNPNYGVMRQPTDDGNTGADLNSSGYRPQSPTPAKRPIESGSNISSGGTPMPPAPQSDAATESIPAPPSEPGPQEF